MRLFEIFKIGQDKKIHIFIWQLEEGEVVKELGGESLYFSWNYFDTLYLLVKIQAVKLKNLTVVCLNLNFGSTQ